MDAFDFSEKYSFLEEEYGDFTDEYFAINLSDLISKTLGEYEYDKKN